MYINVTALRRFETFISTCQYFKNKDYCKIIVSLNDNNQRLVDLYLQNLKKFLLGLPRSTPINMFSFSFSRFPSLKGKGKGTNRSLVEVTLSHLCIEA